VGQEGECKTAALLEHDPEKWAPVFRKDHAQAKRREHDAIHCDRIMFPRPWTRV